MTTVGKNTDNVGLSRNRPGNGQRAEGVVQVVILLTIGGMAGAASFTHVHNVAAAHGQPGWLAWADAVVLELVSIATGLEIRRRHRAGQAAGFVLAVLVGAVALSLSAQVVEAERSVVVAGRRTPGAGDPGVGEDRAHPAPARVSTPVTISRRRPGPARGS